MRPTTDAPPPQVSVVMPARNVAPYVAAAIDSLLKQSIHDIEVLVVDDRSTDGTRREVTRVADHRVRIIEGEGRGVSAARNRGLAAARASYVAFMDGDDTCSGDRLEKQLTFLKGDHDVVAVGTSYVAIDEDGHEIAVVTHLVDSDDVEAAMYSFNPVCGPSLMVRHEALTRIGGYDEALQLGEDYDLCARLLINDVGRLANLAEPLYHYRWHPESTSTRRRAHLTEGLGAVRELLWTRRPPRVPRLSLLLRRGGSATQELQRLRASAYLQLALQLLRRGRARHGLYVIAAVSVANPLTVVGQTFDRLRVRHGGRLADREPVRQAVAHLLRVIVRHVPPRRKGARLVAAANRVIPAPRTTVRTRIAPGVTLSCNVRDSVGWRIFYRGEFEPALTRLLLEELRAGDTFLDVGANCGYYTLLAARAVGRQGVVHAFEPSGEIVERLLADLSRNAFEDRVTIHNVAVGAAPGTAVLGPGTDPTSSEGTRHMATGDQPEDSPDSVEVVALDDLFEGQRVDVVKIDIEGYEEQALWGMGELLKRARPRLVTVEAVESHLARFGSSVAQIVEVMARVGYRHAWLREDGYDDVLVFRPAAAG